MRTIRTTICLGIAFAVALCLAASTAKALPPIEKEVQQDPKVKQAADVADMYQPGMPLVVTLKGNKKLSGTLVYAKPSEDYLMLRTQPRTLPKKIMGKDIADIAKVIPASLGESKPGGVKPAIKGEELPPPGQTQYTPEINTVEVYNGSVRTVRYVAPALSPKEMSLLKKLEDAENSLATAQNAASVNQQLLQNEKQIQNARTEALKHYYKSAAQYALGFRYLPYVPAPLYPAYGYAGSPYRFGTTVFRPYSVPRVNYPYASYYYRPRGIGFAAFMPNPVAGEVDTSIIKQAVAPALAKEASPENVQKAEQQLADARANAIYDANGNLVAMKVEPEAVAAGGDQ